MTDSVTTQEIETTEQPAVQTFEVNWKQLTLEELQKGYMRQDDYTRKTQELAAQKTQEPQDPDQEQAKLWFKQTAEELWYVSKDHLEAQKKENQQEKDLQDTIRDNPDIAPLEQAIRELQKASWLSAEEVIQTYWLKSVDKISRAKSKPMMWNNVKQSWVKDLSEVQVWTPEWEEAKQQLGIK